MEPGDRKWASGGDAWDGRSGQKVGNRRRRLGWTWGTESGKVEATPGVDAGGIKWASGGDAWDEREGQEGGEWGRDGRGGQEAG